MFQINSVSVPTGEQATWWGGYGESVGPRKLGQPTGLGEDASYVLSVPNLGALHLKDTGPNPRQWSILVNGTETYTYSGGGQLSVAVSEPTMSPRYGMEAIATISGGNGELQVPLLSQMHDLGPVLSGIVELVRGAPSLHAKWKADPHGMLLEAGFPRTAMLNFHGSTIGTIPNCCEQLINFLKAIEFPDDATDDLGASWWACTGCKVGLCAAAAALAAVVVAILVGSGGAGATAVVAIESSAAASTFAAASGLTAATVARIAVAVFSISAVSMFVEAVLEKACEAMGACEERVDLEAASPA